MSNTPNPVGPVNYYMITNRAPNAGSPGFSNSVAANGALTFLMAPISNPTTFNIVDQDDWLAALFVDLDNLSEEGAYRWVTFFVHGYGLTFNDAVRVFPTYFANIEGSESPAYPGIYVGFDWPSADDALTQEKAFKAAKANAQLTGAESFPLLLPILQQIKGHASGMQRPVALSAICHSMGNYAMYEGASSLNTKNGPPIFNQILCVAAMLEASGFNDPNAVTYCQDISNAAQRVTIYYSAYDNILPIAEQKGFDGYPELGIWGPTYDNTLLPNVIGVNCSLVVNAANTQKYGVPSPGIHVSYFYIPEVLFDIALTIRARPAGDVPNRSVLTGTAVGFQMMPEPAAQASAGRGRATIGA